MINVTHSTSVRNTQLPGRSYLVVNVNLRAKGGNFDKRIDHRGTHVVGLTGRCQLPVARPMRRRGDEDRPAAAPSIVGVGNLEGPG